MAIILFQGFFKHDSSCQLTLVDLQVQRNDDLFSYGGSNGLTVKVKRSVNNDAPDPLKGAFEVIVDETYDGF